MRRSPKLIFLGILVCFVLPDLLGRTGPEGRIRAICFGDVIDQYGGFNSFVVMRADPAIDATMVPSRGDYLGSYEEAWRNMRIYMPRTYGLLIQDYDLLVTSDADRTVFRPDWIDWMTRSVTDGGLGLEWLGSIQSTSFPSWEATTLAGIAPVEPAPELDLTSNLRVRVLDQQEPLMTALPWEDSPPLANVNTQVPKEGSSIWAVTDHPKGYPLMTYWQVGQGSVLCFSSKFPNGVRPWSRDWPFFPQAMIYLSYRAAEREVPQDALLFKQLFTEFLEYAQRNSLVASVVQFTESFGGRVEGLYRRLDGVAEIKSLADGAYLRGDLEECLDLMGKVKAEQRSITADSMKAKDAALLWVYVTEWCALTSTLLLSGALVWYLMVRRRLYREVGVSRHLADG